MSYYKQLLRGDKIDVLIGLRKEPKTFTVVNKRLSETDFNDRPIPTEIIRVIDHSNCGNELEFEIGNPDIEIVKRTRRPSVIIDGEQVFTDVELLSEFGWIESLYGTSQNKNQMLSGMPELAKKLAWAGNGHSKFLESIYLWFQVVAPRYLWQEMDTYRLSTKQSQSTMFKTSFKLGIDQNDFEHFVDDEYVAQLNAWALERKKLVSLKQNLSEGYLQQRVWCMSYKTLQNIVEQRKNHTLPHWHIFCDRAIELCKRPEYLIKPTT